MCEQIKLLQAGTDKCLKDVKGNDAKEFGLSNLSGWGWKGQDVVLMEMGDMIRSVLII